MNDWTEVPKWVKELNRFMDDTLIDFISEDGSDDDITDKVKDAALAVVCGYYGHLVENDQCGIPDHRYCLICGQPMASVPIGHYEGDPVPRPAAMCMSRGPRIGNEDSVPYCKLLKGHDGLHRPSASDGWDATVVWGDL